jgi:RsiW-degrading membrane proteinase PrsW (M82 family)
MARFELILLAGTLPVLVMLIYTALKLRGGLLNPTTWIAIICGTGVCLPAIGLEMAGSYLQNLMHLGPVASNAILAFGVVGPAEEGMKLIIILALIELGGPQAARRALLAAVGVGIGFALLENLYYLVRSHDILGMAVLRANTAIPVHLMLAMALGAMVVRARVYPRSSGVLICLGFVLAAFLHGAYDFLLSNPFGDLAVSRRLIQFGGIFAIAVFTKVLPIAAAADESRGEPWPVPVRPLCFCAGLLALPWPIMMFIFAVNSHQPGARLLAVFPALIVADMLRSAFVGFRSATNGQNYARA